MNSTTGWKSTNRTKMNNYRDYGKRYQNIRFGQIKSGLAELSNRHGKFWTLNSDQRKVMDGLLKEITSLKPVKRDSTSLSRYAATILGFVNIYRHCSKTDVR